MADLRFPARIVRPEPAEPYVGLPIVSGGVTIDSAQHDKALLYPNDGRYEDVMMRVFGPAGTFEFRFSAETMREALDALEVLRAQPND